MVKEARVLPQRAYWALCRNQWNTLSHKVGSLVSVYKGPSDCHLRRTAGRQGAV